MLALSLPILATNVVLTNLKVRCNFSATGPFKVFEVLCQKPQSLALILKLKQPYPGLISTGGSLANSPNQSSLRAYINGRQIGPSQAQHRVIEQQGGGLYSHWGNNLIFSLPPFINNSSKTLLTGDYAPRVHEAVFSSAIGVFFIGIFFIMFGLLYFYIGQLTKKRLFLK